MAIIIPTPDMQRRILARIDSPDYARLHNPRYSLIANPLLTRYQNCNGFMLNIIASAFWDTTDPARIHDDLAAHFQPTKVEIGAVERRLAPLADHRIQIDDQHGAIATTTFESLGAFMHANGLSVAEYVFKLKP